jgi:hypothetical protein
VRDDYDTMSEDPPADVLSSLPRTRPHRRSEKRGAPKASAARGTARKSSATRATAPKAQATPKAPATPKPKPLRQPEQPAGGPPRRPPASLPRPPAPVSGTDILGTAVQAAAELAEIGLSASARALRAAISRLPRP